MQFWISRASLKNLPPHRIGWSALFVALFLGIGSLSFQARALAKEAEAASQEKAALLAERPDIEEVSADAMAAKLAALREEQRAQSRQFFVDALESLEIQEPSSLLFELKAFVAEIRAAAQEANIRVDEACCFGFDPLIHSGHTIRIEEVENLWGQKQILDNILHMLFESAPAALLSVHCEHVERLFRPELQIFPSLAQNIGSYTFRISFQGKTEALRHFLERIEHSAFPIEVKEVSAQAPTKAFKKDVGGEPILMRAPELSTFTITLEWVQLAEDPLQDSEVKLAPNPPEARQSAWDAPRIPQEEDPWVYELFAPPLIAYRAPNEWRAFLPHTEEGKVHQDKEAVFPLAYLGYSGAEDSYTLWFKDRSSGEVVSARPGDFLEDFNLGLMYFFPERLSEAGSLSPAQLSFWDEDQQRVVDIAAGK